MVPTTISDKAVEIRNQIDRRLAISARPSHSAANAHTLVIRNSRIHNDGSWVSAQAALPYGAHALRSIDAWCRLRAAGNHPRRARAAQKSLWKSS
jgi:hypothetical protein